MAIYRRLSGSWDSYGDAENNSVWINDNGTWKQGKNGWIKVNGSWTKFFSEVPVISYSGSYYTSTFFGTTTLWLTSSGTLNVKHKPWTVSALLVGGGGGGGPTANRTAGGGGGGGTFYINTTIQTGSYYTNIGAGGSGGNYYFAGGFGGQTYCDGIKNPSSKIYVANGGGAGGGIANGYLISPGGGWTTPTEDNNYIYSSSAAGGGSHYSNQTGGTGTYAGGKGWDIASNPPFLFAAGGGGGRNLDNPTAAKGSDGFISASPPPGYSNRYNSAAHGGQGFTHPASNMMFGYGGGGGLQGAFNGGVGSNYWFAFGQSNGGYLSYPTYGMGGWFSGFGNFAPTSAPANSGGGGGGGGTNTAGDTSFASGSGGSGVIGISFSSGTVEIV